MTQTSPPDSSSLELMPRRGATSPTASFDGPERPRKFYHYLPLCLIVVLILAPHPSLFRMLLRHHLQTLQQPFYFVIHLLVTYTLTFCAFSSLIICAARDPGPVTLDEDGRSNNDDADGDVSLREALITPSHEDDFNSPTHWCRVCWAPKPERTHHCSECGRCVLKMDHHCPWLASKCIGHRTYPAFVHFLCCVTLLAAYVAVISAYALLFAFRNPLSIDEETPVHELFLFFAGIIITIVIGSFLIYHIYLISTNQTTLESLSPFLLLRHLPPLPASAQHSLSSPPLEHELSYDQRRLVKDAHAYIRMYDIGWRANWAQVFSWEHRKWGWAVHLACGGASNGNGKIFPRNPRTDELIAKLASELVAADKDS